MITPRISCHTGVGRYPVNVISTMNSRKSRPLVEGFFNRRKRQSYEVAWTPAYAGVTVKRTGVTESRVGCPPAMPKASTGLPPLSVWLKMKNQVPHRFSGGILQPEITSPKNDKLVTNLKTTRNHSVSGGFSDNWTLSEQCISPPLKRWGTYVPPRRTCSRNILPLYLGNSRYRITTDRDETDPALRPKSLQCR
jgi:hypothetical protein